MMSGTDGWGHSGTAAPASTRQAKRRKGLMEATFDVVADKGFEGLRTQAIADRAGVNIALLHYYYPTKDDLIGAFAEYLGELFLSLHAPPVQPTGRKGLDRLRQEFADAAFYMAEHQDLLTVSRELELRAQRDAVVKGHWDRTMGYWHQHLVELVIEGLEDGSFRPDLDPNEVSSSLIALFSGLPSVGLRGVVAVQGAVERWLVRENE